MVKTLVLIMVLLMLCSCAAMFKAPDNSDKKVKARMDQIARGMSKDQVIALVGKPTHIKASNSPQNDMEQWIYSLDTLRANILQPKKKFLGLGGGDRPPGGSMIAYALVIYFSHEKVRTIQK